MRVLVHGVLGPARLLERIADQVLPRSVLDLLTHPLHQHLRHILQHNRVQGVPPGLSVSGLGLCPLHERAPLQRLERLTHPPPIHCRHE